MAARTRARLAVATASAVGTIYGVQGLSPALPVIQRQIGLTDTELGLFTAAYMLPAVVFAIPLGYLADTIGRRRVFVAMTLLWSGAGLLQAWAATVPLLLALRFVQGIGFAALMPLSVTLIGDALEGRAQLRAQASRQVLMTVGELVWPLVGAGLALLSWRAPLAAQAALLPLALAGVRVLDDVAPAGATSKRGYARELTAAVRAPGMPAVLTAGFVRFWCKFAVVAYVPLLLVRGAGASVAEAAAVVAVTSLVAALASTRVLAALRWAPASRLLMGAVTLVGGALIGIAAAPDWRLALVAAVAFGIGDGFLMVLQNAFVTEAAPADVRAGVVAVSGTTRNAGKLLAPLAVGGLLIVAPLPAAFVVVALTTWAVVPSMRSLARLDSSLGPRMIVSDIQRRSADARHVP